MQVLHSIWDMNTLYIWAESSERPLTATDETTRQSKQDKQDPKPHPFSMPGHELKNQLPDAFSRAGPRVELITVRLPSTKTGPVPSPWLLLEDCAVRKATALGDWTVDALAYEPVRPSTFSLIFQPILLQAPSSETLSDSGRTWRCYPWSLSLESSLCPQ